MKLKFNALLLLMSCLTLTFTSCGDDFSDLDYTITIMEPTSEDKTLGDDMHVHVNFDEANQKRIYNIRVVIKTLEEGLVKYDSGIIKALTDGHYEHLTDFTLDVTPGSTLVLEAAVFTDEGIDDETLQTKKSVQFMVK